VYLNAIIDCLNREIVGWELSVRCRATEAIAVIQTAVRDRASAGDSSRSARTTGPRSLARRLALRSPGSASLTVAAATATARAKRSSTYGSAI
jgi:transposase InsO family protein